MSLTWRVLLGLFAGLPLRLALDMLRTTENVTGSVTAATMAGGKRTGDGV